MTMRVAMHVAAAVSCLLLSSGMVVPVAGLDVSKDHELRQEFVKAMGQASGARRHMRTKLQHENQQEQPAALTKRLLQVARPVEGTSTTTMSSSTFQDRELAENQNNNDQQQYAVNLTAYALKYIGCQNIHTFSDEMAEDQDSTTVLAMNRFVMFRLCPRDSCSNYNALGCSAGYGDYMISMEEYLAAMVEYFYAEYQEYCETCYYCMQTAANADTNYNNNNDDANGTDDGRRGLSNNGYYNSGYYQFQDDDGDAGDDAAAATDNAGDDSGHCEYYDVCERYKSACKHYTSKAAQFEDYFQCNAFNMGNMVGYMGPHCMSDGVTISIGLYSDQNCNQYQSDLADMSAYTGLDFAHSYLRTFYSENCISCMASEGFGLNTQDEEAEESPAVSDICYVLYGESAKCNKYMGSNGGYSSYSQQATESTVCGFISSLIENNYDEYGEIYLDNDSVSWMKHIPVVREMSPFQRGAMAASIALMLVLFAYAIVLYRQVNTRRRFIWSPNGDGLRISRRSSGIISGRSRSGGRFEMRGGVMS